MNKDDNIGFHEYIDNQILWIYKKILIDILIQHIDEIKND